MGTGITLDLSGMTVTYSKNGLGIDHGSLFQKKDIKRVRHEGIDYEALEVGPDEDNEEFLACMETVMQNNLGKVKVRLELLGFTLENIRKEFLLRTEQESERESYAGEVYSNSKDWMDFHEFLDFIKSIKIDELNDDYTSHYNNEHWLEIVTGRFTDEDLLKRIPCFEGHFHSSTSEIESFKCLIGFLHPWSALRLMAENPDNAEALLTWDYGPLVYNGWANENDINPNASREENFLIATEGTSDVHILRHAFKLLMPEIQDFFTFIDVSERHPFSGASSLVKFAEGLVSIDVQNQIVFLLDNDAEGRDAMNKIRNLKLPPNMSCIHLPDMEIFTSFQASGPDGVRNTNINGRAVAIECYLDHNVKGYEAPCIRWTNFKESTGSYQGALMQKEGYVKNFLRLNDYNLAEDNYDTSKIKAVLAAIVATCADMAATNLRKWLLREP